ncbi:UNVERIFIED_CONTAM: hypothetical protein HDU68_008147 [Siphonaria sp. JEL0065]|nr:hypothetical protein HDU68_008147 [Siphonaria sp. JEL0065]
MLSGQGQGQDDMTDSVRDGLLFSGKVCIDFDNSNSVAAAKQPLNSLKRKTKQLAQTLAKQTRRRSSLNLGHVAPDTRAMMEGLALDANTYPALFVRAVLATPDYRLLLQGLLALMRDCDNDSRIMAHTIELALLIFRDKELRQCLLDLGAFDLLCAKVPLVRENLSLILKFIEAATREMILPLSAESRSLISFLQSNVLTSSCPSLSVLSIIANSCKNTDVAKFVNSLEYSERFLRHVMGYLSDPDMNFLTVVHSLQILVRLTVDDPLGQRVFKDSNIDQIWRLVFSMLEKGTSYSLDPVLDLLEETVAIPKFCKSLQK